MDTTLHGQNVMWPDSQNEQNSSKQAPSWTNFQEDRTKHERKAELTESIVDTILRGQNVMWPDSQVNWFQVDNHPGGLTPK